MTPADSPEPKFRRRAEDRPDEVLDAAVELFEKQGYARTSVEQIARAAGISKGAVYLYFPSKQAILEGIVQRAVAPIRTDATALTTSTPPDIRQSLTMVLHLIARRLRDPKIRAVPRIVIREAAAVPEVAEMYRSAVLDAVIPEALAILRHGIDTGQIRPVDPEMTLRSIFGPLMGHLALSEIFGIAPEDGLAMERLVENHLDILFHGLTPDTSR